MVTCGCARRHPAALSPWTLGGSSLGCAIGSYGRTTNRTVIRERKDTIRLACNSGSDSIVRRVMAKYWMVSVARDGGHADGELWSGEREDGIPNIERGENLVVDC